MSKPHGIRLSYIVDFVKTNHIDATTITRDICMNLIIPATTNSRLSYCDLLKDSNPNEVSGIANIFVSHSWSYFFTQVVDILTKNFSGDTYIWFDIFCQNQHVQVSNTSEWSQVFRDMVKVIGKVGIVICDWKTPVVFNRIWCLFEVFTCIESGGNLSILMNDDLDIFGADIATIERALFTINILSAEATQARDKEILLGVFLQARV